MRFIITCSGRQERWGNYLDVPKHLVPIDDEPLLHRTVRLIKKFTDDADIYVMAFDPRYDVPGTTRYEPKYDTIEEIEEHFNSPAIYASRKIWSPDDQTIILFGDTFFTESAMRRICNKRLSEGYIFFGRAESSFVTNCPWGELWGVTFTHKFQKDFLSAIISVRTLRDEGTIKKWRGWEIYRYLQGLNLKSHDIGDNFYEINDFTEDFDFPRDYRNWIRKWEDLKVEEGGAYVAI